MFGGYGIRCCWLLHQLHQFRLILYKKFFYSILFPTYLLWCLVIMKLKFRVFCVFVVVLLSAIGCSDDDPRDPDLVIYEGCLFCI